MRILFRLGKNALIWQNGFRWVLVDQLWFWTDKWQAGEKEVDEQIRQGRFESFESIDDMIQSLNSTNHELEN